MGDEGRGSRSTARTGISILCRNLPIDIGPEEVKDVFAAFGEIRDVYLPKDHYNGRAKGFGFIEFSDGRDADDAVRSLNNSDIGGRTVSVIHSKQSRKTPRDMARMDEGGSRQPAPDRHGRRRHNDRDSHHRSDRNRSRRRRHSSSRSCSPQRRRRLRSHDRGRCRSPPVGRGHTSPVPRRRTSSRDGSPQPLRRLCSPQTRRHDSRSPAARQYSRSPAHQRRLSPLSRSRSHDHCSGRSISHSVSPVLRRHPPPLSCSPAAEPLPVSHTSVKSIDGSRSSAEA